MNSSFYKLLDNTLAEVQRREPGYLSSFPIAVCREGMAAAYRDHPLCNELPAESIDQALTEGLEYLGKSRIKSAPANGSADPVAGLLCDCIVDAFCADQGVLTLQPHEDFSGSTTGTPISVYRSH